MGQNWKLPKLWHQIPSHSRNRNQSYHASWNFLKKDRVLLELQVERPVAFSLHPDINQKYYFHLEVVLFSNH